MIQTRTIGSHTEIYIDKNGGGKSETYITQSKTTVFHDFFTRKFLGEGETVEDFMEVTEAEKQTLEQARNAWVRPPQIFIDQWNTACGIWGRYNEETGYFELNGLTDITYEEALRIFFRTISFSAQCSRRIYTVNDIRTNLPLQLNLEANGSNTIQSFRFFCSNNDSIEVLNFSTFSGSRISPDLGADAYQGNTQIVYGCPKLKRIVGTFSLYRATQNMWPFNKLPELEDVNISHLYTGTLHLEMLPKLNLNSFAYLVSHKYQNADTPVMVHPTVYAKLTGDTTNEEVAAMDPEELQKWMELMPLAAEKNITFVA